MAAVEKLGYTPDASARKMRGMRNQIIALSARFEATSTRPGTTPTSCAPHGPQGMQEHDVMLLTGPDAVKDIRRVTSKQSCGWHRAARREQDDERAAQSGTFSKPCVAIGYPSSHAGCAWVDIDFALMGRKAVDFLYEKGHRTVVFLRNNESDYNRHSGYVVIFRESLLAHAKELGMTVIESEHYRSGQLRRAALRQHRLRAPRPPDRHHLNQANASVLSQVLMALHDAGMSIPQGRFGPVVRHVFRRRADALPHHRECRSCRRSCAPKP